MTHFLLRATLLLGLAAPARVIHVTTIMYVTE